MGNHLAHFIHVRHNKNNDTLHGLETDLQYFHMHKKLQISQPLYLRKKESIDDSLIDTTNDSIHNNNIINDVFTHFSHIKQLENILT